MGKQFCRFFTVLSVAAFLSCSVLSNFASEAKSDEKGKDTKGVFTIKTDVTMVTTDVTVVGPDVDNLTREDFVVYDNGVAHPVTHFSRNELPLAIALLIDTSISVEQYLPLIQVAAGSALRSLKPEDQVVLFSFNNQHKRNSDLTYDRFEIAEKIAKLKFALGTDIYDTIIDAAEYLLDKAHKRRRAIIMISDNYHVKFAGSEMYDLEDKKNKRGEAREKSLEAALTMYGIQTPSIGADVTNSVPVLRGIAEDTGGEIIPLNDWTSLQDAMNEVVSKLRRQYTLGFNPSELGDDGSFHNLEVKFADESRCSDCRILARKGYYAGTSSPSPSIEKKKIKLKYSREQMDQMLIKQSMYTVATYSSTRGRESNLTGIDVKAQAYRSRTVGGKRTVKVKIDINSDRIKFRKEKDRYKCKIHIGVFTLDSIRNPMDTDFVVSDTDVQLLEGELKESTYREALKSGISYTAEVPLKSNRQLMKVVVYDEFSDRVGSRSVRFMSSR